MKVLKRLEWKRWGAALSRVLPWSVSLKNDSLGTDTFELSREVEYRHLNLMSDAQVRQQNEEVVAFLEARHTFGFKGLSDLSCSTFYKCDRNNLKKHNNNNNKTKTKQKEWKKETVLWLVSTKFWSDLMYYTSGRIWEFQVPHVWISQCVDI